MNDAYVSYQWVRQHAKELGGDPTRVVVGGESAGGNLATVVSLRARAHDAQASAGAALRGEVPSSDARAVLLKRLGR